MNELNLRRLFPFLIKYLDGNQTASGHIQGSLACSARKPPRRKQWAIISKSLECLSPLAQKWKSVATVDEKNAPLLPSPPFLPTPAV